MTMILFSADIKTLFCLLAERDRVAWAYKNSVQYFSRLVGDKHIIQVTDVKGSWKSGSRLIAITSEYYLSKSLHCCGLWDGTQK